MTKKQQGFTLIELVAVIVILGALAVVALPRFINLQDEAEAAALEGVKGAANAAHAINLAGALASDGNQASVADCDDTPDVLQGGAPDGYNFPAATGTVPTAEGEAFDCEVVQTATSATAAYTGYIVN